MKIEKIAIIALITIIATTLSIMLISSFGDDIMNNLFSNTSPSQEYSSIIKDGDCADINYIARYASNNTIFDSSYNDTDEKTGGTPLQIFVTTDDTKQNPSGFSNYTSGYIPGLISRLIGTKQGESYTFEIPPEEAYGAKKLKVGDRFNSSSFALNTLNPSLSLNQTLEVTKLNDSNFTLKWVNLDSYGKFTMPQMILNDLLASTYEDMILLPPLYFIWENSSEIVNYTDDIVTIKTTPTKTENLCESFEPIQYGFNENEVFALFPNETIASYDEDTITLRSNPEIGAEYEYSYSYYGQKIMMIYTVENLTENTIDFTIDIPEYNQTQNQTVVRSIEFNRTYDFPRNYEDLPVDYQETLIGSDLKREGYSLHELAGETLIFDVTIEHVYKTSKQ
jgi:FKBP-type peptidyl-prolyl cis-trans isomerase 2